MNMLDIYCDFELIVCSRSLLCARDHFVAMDTCKLIVNGVRAAPFVPVCPHHRCVWMSHLCERARVCRVYRV